MFSDVKILISFEFLDLPASTIGAFSMVSPLESNNIFSSLLFVSPYQNPIDLEKFGRPNLYVFVNEGKNDSLIQTYTKNSFSSVSL